MNKNITPEDLTSFYKVLDFVAENSLDRRGVVTLDHGCVLRINNDQRTAMMVRPFDACDDVYTKLLTSELDSILGEITPKEVPKKWKFDISL